MNCMWNGPLFFSFIHSPLSFSTNCFCFCLSEIYTHLGRQKCKKFRYSSTLINIIFTTLQHIHSKQSVFRNCIAVKVAIKQTISIILVGERPPPETMAEPIVIIDDSDDEAAAVAPSSTKPDMNSTEPGKIFDMSLHQGAKKQLYHIYICIFVICCIYFRTNGMPDLPADLHSSGAPSVWSYFLLPLR